MRVFHLIGCGPNVRSNSASVYFIGPFVLYDGMKMTNSSFAVPSRFQLGCVSIHSNVCVRQVCVCFLSYTHAFYALFYTIGQIKCNRALFGTTYCCTFLHDIPFASIYQRHDILFLYTVARMPNSIAMAWLLSSYRIHGATLLLLRIDCIVLWK